jgi:hypothetical protein
MRILVSAAVERDLNTTEGNLEKKSYGRLSPWTNLADCAALPASRPNLKRTMNASD